MFQLKISFGAKSNKKDFLSEEIQFIVLITNQY